MIESIVLAGALLAGPTTAGTAAIEQAQAAASVIPKAWRPFAECVSRRESNHSYRSVNRSSGAAGRWQFMPAWQHGLPYMVVERLVANGYPKAMRKALRVKLQQTPIQKWPGTYQDVGFVAALLAPNGHGWRHWSLPGHRCQSLVPAVAR
jgi:hypothetical protein